jgi:hypothetical protein
LAEALAFRASRRFLVDEKHPSPFFFNGEAPGREEKLRDRQTFRAQQLKLFGEEEALWN